MPTFNAVAVLYLHYNNAVYANAALSTNDNSVIEVIYMACDAVL